MHNGETFQKRPDGWVEDVDKARVMAEFSKDGMNASLRMKDRRDQNLTNAEILENTLTYGDPDALFQAMTDVMPEAGFEREDVTAETIQIHRDRFRSLARSADLRAKSIRAKAEYDAEHTGEIYDFIVG